MCLITANQIAFHDAVFVVDVLWCAHSPASMAALDALLAALLLDPAVLLLGCGVEANDVPRLSQSYPQLRSVQLVVQHGVASALDVQQLPSLLVQGRGSRRPPSLAAVCAAMLGAPLAKDQQRSAWGARPLTPLQLRYAADDAAVLLEMLSMARSLPRAALLARLAPLCDPGPLPTTPPGAAQSVNPDASSLDAAPASSGGPTTPASSVAVDVPQLLGTWLGRSLPARGQAGVQAALRGVGPDGGPAPLR